MKEWSLILHQAPLCPWTLHVWDKKRLFFFFFLAKTNALNLVKRVRSTCAFRKAADVSLDHRYLWYWWPLLLSMETMLSAAPFALTGLLQWCASYFWAPSLRWDLVVKHPSCTSMHSIAFKTQAQVIPLERWRSMEWLHRNDTLFLWKQTVSIRVISALLEEKKIRGSFHYFYHSYPAESTLLWESTTVFALWIQRIMNFPPTEGCLHILSNFAYALSYSCAILLQKRGCGSVQHKQHLAPGNLFTAADDDWAKESMTWSHQVSSWAFSHGRVAWGAIFNIRIEICCWYWENGGGAPQWSFGNTSFKDSSNVWQL